MTDPDAGLREALTALLTEYSYSADPAPYTTERGLFERLQNTLAAHPAPTKHYDHRDNLTWHHDDGTPCDVFWSDRPHPNERVAWWCTEHQQHLHSATVPAPPVTVTDEMVERAARIIDPAGRGTGLDVARRTARAALSAALNPEEGR